MAKNHGPSIKDDKLYEDIRDDGMSKEKAARIANANAAGGEPFKKGGKADQYNEWTKEQLYNLAAEIGIEGRSDMRKDELIDALRNR